MSQKVIAAVGLGYVGLPLAVEFGKKFKNVGYDLSERKVVSYRNCRDPSDDIPDETIRAAKHLLFTTDPSHLSKANFIIVAVPTPVDAAHQLDFAPLVSASITVGKQLKRGATLVYESTVYPGATEEVRIPIL